MGRWRGAGLPAAAPAVNATDDGTARLRPDGQAVSSAGQCAETRWDGRRIVHITSPSILRSLSAIEYGTALAENIRGIPVALDPLKPRLDLLVRLGRPRRRRRLRVHLLRHVRHALADRRAAAHVQPRARLEGLLHLLALCPQPVLHVPTPTALPRCPREGVEELDHSVGLPLRELVFEQHVLVGVAAADEEVGRRQFASRGHLARTLLHEAAEWREAASGAEHDHRRVLYVGRGVEIAVAGLDRYVDEVVFLDCREVI